MSDFMSWVTHGIKRGKFEMSPRAVIAAAVLVAIATVIAASYLMLVSRTAASGRHIEQLRAELMVLRRENQQAEVEIAGEISIPSLLERAEALGFEAARLVDALTASTPE